MVVRELVALLGVETNGPQFKKAFSSLTGLADYAKLAGVAIAGVKVVQWVQGIYQEIATAGDALFDLSQKTGIATDQLQALDFVASQTGSNLGDLSTGFRILQKNQSEALKGGSEAAKTFKRLGIDIKDSSGKLKPASELMIDSADAFAKLGSDAERTDLAMKLFGRSGTALIPMLKNGSAALREMMGEAEALGGIFDQELIDASNEYSDNVVRMQSVTKGIKATIAKQFLPVVNSLYLRFFDWWKINREWISLKIGVAFSKIANVVGNFLEVVGDAVRLFVDWLKNLTPIEKGIGKIGIAIVALGALIKAGPIGKLLLLADLILLIIDDFKTWEKGGKSVIGTIINWFLNLTGIDLTYWIKNIVPAFQWMWSGVKAILSAWFQYIAALADFFVSWLFDPLEAISTFVDALKAIGAEWFAQSDVAKAAVEALLGLWQGFVNWFVGLWDGFVAWFSGLWPGVTDAFVGFLEGLWNSATSWIPKIVKYISDGLKGAFGKVGEWVGEKLFETEKIQKPSEKVAGMRSLMASPMLGGAGIMPGAGGFGGGAEIVPQTVAATRGPGGGSVFAPKTDIKIDVKAAPGMDENKLASEVAKRVQEHQDRQNRAAMRALTPSAATGPL